MFLVWAYLCIGGVVAAQDQRMQETQRRALYWHGSLLKGLLWLPLLVAAVITLPYWIAKSEENS